MVAGLHFLLLLCTCFFQIPFQVRNKILNVCIQLFYISLRMMIFCLLIVTVSRFILFVITPDWLADRFRDDIVPGILCLVIVILITLLEIRGVGGLENCECSCYCFSYWFSMACLLYITISYLAT